MPAYMGYMAGLGSERAWIPAWVGRDDKIRKVPAPKVKFAPLRASPIFTRFNSVFGGQRPNSSVSTSASSGDGGAGSRPGDYAIVRVPP
jgi:hypothetical protein